QGDGKGPIGYLQISSFNQTTAEQVSQHLAELQSNQIEGLVLDLRFNPGGLVDQVIHVAGHFIPPGPVVFTEDRNGNRISYRTQSEQTQFDKPLVVLVNEATASAAEILSGA